MLLKDFDYAYPPSLVAQKPLERRDQSRMMVIHRKEKKWHHDQFANLEKYLQAGDLLIFNNSKVFPCRLVTQTQTGGRVEVFLVRELESKLWSCLIRTPNNKRQAVTGSVFLFNDQLQLTIKENNSDGTFIVELKYEGSLMDLLDRIGHVPLPPYMQRPDEPAFDRQRYQNVYAKNVGSVAAPTAGFHFTPEKIDSIKNRGMDVGYVTLHVGLGTFLPIRTEKIEDHKMHGEYYDIPTETLNKIHETKKRGGRVIAVGTTAVRALESADNQLVNGLQFTEKFITPGYQFKVVDALLTNFHQPQSTLIVLVSAFVGDREFVLQAYQEAINEQYRLFSYGDCMLIV